MRHFLPPALILLLILPALGAQRPEVRVYPFGVLGVQAGDGARVTRALSALLSACAPYEVAEYSGEAKLTGLEILAASDPVAVFAQDSGPTGPQFRITGLVAQSPDGDRVIQVAALRSGEKQLQFGLPVHWPLGKPLPSEAVVREAARALGPLATVTEVRTGDARTPQVPSVLDGRGGKPDGRTGQVPSLRVKPVGALPPGEYALCEVITVAADAPGEAPRVYLSRSVGSILVREPLAAEDWIGSVKAIGPVRVGLALAVKTPSSLHWPAGCRPVEVRSQPPLCFASLGDHLQGVTPCLACLPAGAQELTLSHADLPVGKVTVPASGAGAVLVAIGPAPAAAPTVKPAPTATVETAMTTPTTPLTAAGGRLSVRSDPAGAEVRLDDKPLGKTPLTLETAPPGKHRVSLRAKAFEAWSTELEFVAGKTTDIEVRLAQAAQTSAVAETPATPVTTPRAPRAAAMPGPLAKAENLPLAQEAAQVGEVLSVPLLTGKGSPRVREAHIKITPLGDNTVRCGVTMDDGLPQGTRVAMAPNMVSVVIPDALALEEKRKKHEVQLGGVESVQTGQQSDRDRTVRVQLDLRNAATTSVRDERKRGFINLDVTLPGGGHGPQQETELPRGGLWTKYPTPDKQAALTFDDFPTEGTSDRLLQVLHESGVPATLFVIGHKAVESEWLMQLAMEDGFTFGNHTYNHPRLLGVDSERVAAEIERCSAVLVKITGKRPKYFRPPGGGHDARITEIVKDHGLRLVMWDACSNDYDEIPPTRIVNDIMRTISGHQTAVVLLHDGSNTTIKAVPEVIHELRMHGYKIVTLDELLGD